jgi:asparagine synthase (glutamine-hydrolysing)
LSGGIDSSLVSAVTRSLHPNRSLKAYTLRFDEHSFDEGRFAEVVAKQFKMELVTVRITPDDVRTGLKSLIQMVGEPLADPAWIPTTLLAQRATQETKMALVGEGADELFGGYPSYVGAGIDKYFVQLPSWLRFGIQRMVEALPLSEKKVTISFLLKRFMQGAGCNDMTRHRLWVSNITPALLRRLGVTPTQFESSDAGGGNLLDRAQQWDLEMLLAEGLLTKADRASMSSALELRAPFLDQAVMEFAKSLRVEDRVRGFKTKVFLKRYARRYLPNNIVRRRKRGLSVPINIWLRGPLKEWAISTLRKGHLEQVGIRTSAAMELLSEHCQHEADHARAIWTLLVLGEWLDWVATDIDCRHLQPSSISCSRGSRYENEWSPGHDVPTRNHQPAASA